MTWSDWIGWSIMNMYFYPRWSCVLLCHSWARHVSFSTGTRVSFSTATVWSKFTLVLSCVIVPLLWLWSSCDARVCDDSGIHTWWHCVILCWSVCVTSISVEVFFCRVVLQAEPALPLGASLRDETPALFFRVCFREPVFSFVVKPPLACFIWDRILPPARLFVFLIPARVLISRW